MTWEAILLCEFVVPQNAIASYYSEFYLYAPAYAEAIDLSEISDTAYTLKKDGETVAVFTDSLVKTEPTCEVRDIFRAGISATEARTATGAKEWSSPLISSKIQ